ncbi:MAG: trypsin-like peptidase domain-containing protein [Acidimicrobiia bacterium]|nr:trypsin-like peptidase domain-containing protein [Acidimicrobiia bacterium]
MPTWRERLLPKSVLGMTMLLLMASLGAAFSGTVLYAYYEYRLNKNEQRVTNFINGFDKNFKGAINAIDTERENAKSQIRQQLAPLEQIAAEGSTLGTLLKNSSPSVWFVHTLDESGQPSVGSAFVVASDSNQTLLLTSFNTVRAATHQPGPTVSVSRGGDEEKVQLWTWEEDKDLALLILPKTNQPRLNWSSDSPPVKTGDRVFAVSGYGAAGGSITQGLVADLSSNAIMSDTQIGPAFQGGPIINSKGDVVAVASRAYAPFGFPSDGVFFSVPIHAACDQVLRCPSGTPNAPGQQGH